MSELTSIQGLFMKKHFSSLAIIAGVLSSTLFAALPPLSQSAKEIEAIVESSELSNKLDQAGAIRLIKKGRDNSYIVLTTKQKMRVDVIYQTRHDSSSGTNSSVGPQQFTLVFHDPVPIDERED